MSLNDKERGEAFAAGGIDNPLRSPVPAVSETRTDVETEEGEQATDPFEQIGEQADAVRRKKVIRPIAPKGE